jgi:hypothetical protein
MKILDKLQPFFLAVNTFCFFYFLFQKDLTWAAVSAAGVACYFVQKNLKEIK